MSSQSEDRGKGKAVSQSSEKAKKKVQFADKPSYLGESQPTASSAAQQAEDRAQKHHRQETVAGMADMGSSIRRTILAERAEGPFAHDGNPLPPVSPTKTVQYFNGKFQRVGSRSVEEAQRSAEAVERVQQSTKKMKSGMAGMEDFLERDLLDRV
jgi:hypothetical protein